MEVANAKIQSSMERNLEGNLILMVLGFVRITRYCRRNKQRPERSEVIAPPSPFFAEGACLQRVTCSSDQLGKPG